MYLNPFSETSSNVSLLCAIFFNTKPITRQQRTYLNIFSQFSQYTNLSRKTGQRNFIKLVTNMEQFMKGWTKYNVNFKILGFKN